MLSYLGNSVRPEFQMAVHQCARFLVNPMRSHKVDICVTIVNGALLSRLIRLKLKSMLTLILLVDGVAQMQ